MKKQITLFIIALISCFTLFSQEIEFTIQVPKVVGKGERFKVSFVVNDDKPKNFIAPTFQDVNILSGPNVMRSSSVSIINLYLFPSKPKYRNNNDTSCKGNSKRQNLLHKSGKCKGGK